MLYRQLFILFQQLIVCVILIIRTYALYNCSKRLLIWVTLIFIALAGGSSAGTIGQYAGNLTPFPGVGCFETYTVNEYVIILAVLRVYSKVIADLPVVG
ncbi:uncharacterized protein BJ212DRAFT_1358841 [Suillus subaureus]|uniref:Uncharacterized protein n=1 Tax=Suillus subaureus TaxID=48587 RepID=A0A9P7E9R0_9AGAM|nr:uncharacterized protein BJ212DRAFT_1358841 [Suillus subaureus]KAG1815015.1 hypothetical protein BJ212DRAFT_1358841 [Suillus subaureus]